MTPDNLEEQQRGAKIIGDNRPRADKLGRADTKSQQPEGNWLADKSEEELVDLIFEITHELKSRMVKGTLKIAPDSDSLIFRDDVEVEQYLRMPTATKKTPDEVAATTWRIILIGSQFDDKPLALEIYDDISIGRSTDDAKMNIDLTEYDGSELGVSRLHALIRPEKDKLLLLDLKSTNGTFCNSIAVEPDAPQEIKNNDTISFSNLSFKVKIVSQP